MTCKCRHLHHACHASSEAMTKYGVIFARVCPRPRGNARDQRERSSRRTSSHDRACGQNTRQNRHSVVNRLYLCQIHPDGGLSQDGRMTFINAVDKDVKHVNVVRKCSQLVTHDDVSPHLAHRFVRPRSASSSAHVPARLHMHVLISPGRCPSLLHDGCF